MGTAIRRNRLFQNQGTHHALLYPKPVPRCYINCPAFQTTQTGWLKEYSRSLGMRDRFYS